VVNLDRRLVICRNAPSSVEPVAGEDPRHALVRSRAREADGTFVYAVRTTGVFCRPSCPSRAARTENVEFFDDPAAARRAGYRACLRCRPESAPRETGDAALVARICRRLDEAEPTPTLATLADEVGLGVSALQRAFRRVTGLTPAAYAREARARRVRDALTDGRTVTAAMHAAGYGSSGRFYEEADTILGMTPTRRRQGGKGVEIEVTIGSSGLGRVLVAWTTRGICALALGDDEAALRSALDKDFGLARIRNADVDGAALLAEVLRLVEGRRASRELPLDLRGTVFQMQVWQALRKIPPGTTVTYAELARRIGRPEAVRAVASACARNHIALLVPCHRVVRSDGSLADYRWGLERKKALLARESGPRAAPSGQQPPGP